MGHRKGQALGAYMPELKIEYFIKCKSSGALVGPYGEKCYAEEVVHAGDTIIWKKKKKVVMTKNNIKIIL